MTEPYVIVNNEDNEQFEIVLERERAFLEYRWYKNSLALMHTFVPDSIGGKGLASALAAHAFEYAKSRKIKVRIYCSFVADYIKQHPEYNHLVDKF
ncbi:MAG TPA: GNAT family N-acetyltransferase [Flavisolibacter sp.]|nr:GNAT family N-acetyltransferase [Flavisolibacter sp.]